MAQIGAWRSCQGRGWCEFLLFCLTGRIGREVASGPCDGARIGSRANIVRHGCLLAKTTKPSQLGLLGSSAVPSIWAHNGTTVPTGQRPPRTVSRPAGGASRFSCETSTARQKEFAGVDVSKAHGTITARTVFLSRGYSEQSSGLHHVEHVSDMAARRTVGGSRCSRWCLPETIAVLSQLGLLGSNAVPSI